MRPILDIVSVMLLVGCCVAALAVAGEQECDGLYKGRQPTPEELENVLRHHLAWVESGGKPDDTRNANLCQAILVAANLQKASLVAANLQEANLSYANLEWANLLKANLQKASLVAADFQETNLQEANLQKASLGGANLLKADLTEATLAGAIYEPDPDSPPLLWSLTSPNNKLEEPVFYTTPAGLTALREAFKKAGMRTQERQLTYAIEHTKRLKAWDP